MSRPRKEHLLGLAVRFAAPCTTQQALVQVSRALHAAGIEPLSVVKHARQRREEKILDESWSWGML